MPKHISKESIEASCSVDRWLFFVVTLTNRVSGKTMSFSLDRTKQMYNRWFLSVNHIKGATYPVIVICNVTKVYSIIILNCFLVKLKNIVVICNKIN